MTTAPAGRTTVGRKRIIHAEPRRKRTPVVVESKHGKEDDTRNEFSEQEWHAMVATAAYYRAQARGFDGDCVEGDWYEAEAGLQERFSPGSSSVEMVSDSGGGATNIETTRE